MTDLEKRAHDLLVFIEERADNYDEAIAAIVAALQQAQPEYDREHEGDTCRASDCYAGNSVGWWKSKADNYGNGLAKVCAALGSIGVKMDGNTPCWEYVSKLHVDPHPEPQGLDAAVEAGNEGYIQEAKRQGFRPPEAWHRSQQAKDWMRAALIAATPHLRGQVPEGYVLVQIRDARNLIEHVQHSVTSRISARRVRDLIAAAPAAPVQEKGNG